MWLDLSRAHKRCLGLTGSYRPPRDEEITSIRSVEVTQRAKTALQAQLDAPGQYRGGPLLGYRRDGVIVVLHAVSAGYKAWHRPDQGPLEIDERYLLGWIDCLRDIADTPLPVDWVGTWLSYPNSQLYAGFEENLEWIGRAAETRLIDERHCLLIVGWMGGELGASAYAEQAEEGAIVPLYHNLAGGQSRTVER